MVFAFILQTVLPGPCRILYSNTYIPDCFQPEFEGRMGDNTSYCTKEGGTQLQSIADEIQSDYGFRVATSSRSYELEMQRLGEGTLPDFEIGYFRVPSCVPGAAVTSVEEKVVVWLAALNTAFSLICDTNENRMIAETVLKVIIKHLQDHCRILGEPNIALNEPDKVALVVDQFLPKGKLLFMNHRVTRQFEKELEIKMKSQT